MRRIIVIGVPRGTGPSLYDEFIKRFVQNEFEIKRWPEVEMNLAAKSSGPEVTHKGKRVAQWKVEKRGGAR